MIFHVHDSWAGENPQYFRRDWQIIQTKNEIETIKEISIKITWFLGFWSNDGKCESEKCKKAKKTIA